MDNSRVLVVDDDNQVRDVLVLSLENFNFIVDSVDNGYGALDKVKSNHYDLVLSDIKMPGLNGVDLAKELLKIKLPGKIILMTGFSGEYTEEDVLSIGVDAYIEKPFNLEYLIRVITNVLNK